jgi:hypothetical protein
MLLVHGDIDKVRVSDAALTCFQFRYGGNNVAGGGRMVQLSQLFF